MSTQELKQLVPVILEEMKQAQKSNEGWIELQQAGCKAFKQGNQNGVLTKGVTEVKFSYLEVAEFLEKPESFPKYNEKCKESKILHEQKGEYEIRYKLFQTPFPLENRELVTLHVRRQEGEKIYLAEKSCNFNLENPENAVRGKCHIMGWVIEMVDKDTTKLTHLMHVDPMGMIPEMFKAEMAERRAGTAGIIENMMMKETAQGDN